MRTGTGPALVYINAITNVSNVRQLIFFADDTSLFHTHRNVISLIAETNEEMKIKASAKNVKLSLNTKKSNFIIFTSKSNIIW